MSTPSVSLHAFVFGEQLEGVPPRSLGYRLLAPTVREPWSAEVEALARQFQAAPYPDHWPATALFCSVLLADGQRLIAVARYGLTDHTASRRRGGLELFGVVGPGALSATICLTIYRWLRQRLGQGEDLRLLAGGYELARVVAEAPPAPAPQPVVALPIRLHPDGTLLFAATTPADPDQRLGLLEQEVTGAWQWLPLVGPEFPLHTYSQRGALIAWTPHLTDVAVQLDRKPVERVVRPSRLRRLALQAWALVFLVLLGANLWGFLALSSRLTALEKPATSPTPQPEAKGPPPPPETDLKTRDEFIQALSRLLLAEGGPAELKRIEPQLRKRYKVLAARDNHLRQDKPEAQVLVGAVSVLAQRTADRIEELIRQTFANQKGYDADLIELIGKRVRERLAAEAGKAP
jgi:hypothetical protein